MFTYTHTIMEKLLQGELTFPGLIDCTSSKEQITDCQPAKQLKISQDIQANSVCKNFRLKH